jgi:hypothetical protein
MRCIRRNQVSGLLVARGRLLPRRICLFVFYAYLALAVSACSLKESLVKQAGAPPPAAEKTKPLEPIAAMPSAMDTFRALAPPEGLSFTPLFNEPIKDSDARAKRLEDAVQTLRNDFDTVMPTVVRLAAIEKDIKGLVAQLQTLTGEGQPAPAPVTAVTPQEIPPPVSGGEKIPGEDVAKGTEPATAPIAVAGPDASSSLVTPEAAPKGELPPEGAASPISTAPTSTEPMNIKPQATPETPPPAPVAVPAPQEATPAPAPEQKTEAAPAPAPASLNGDVIGVRIADHPDKTRLVLDMTVKNAGAVKLENDGKTLVIDVSQMNWTGSKSWEANSAQLISGWHVGGGNLYVDLMYASQIKTQSVLAPAGSSKNYRLVVDLFSAEVHK